MINAVAACVQGPPQYTDGINALQGFKCITCSALIPMSRWDNYIELYVACSSAVYTVYMHAWHTVVYSGYITVYRRYSTVYSYLRGTIHCSRSINQPRLSVAIFTCSLTVRTRSPVAFSGHKGCFVCPFMVCRWNRCILKPMMWCIFTGSFINGI